MGCLCILLLRVPRLVPPGSRGQLGVPPAEHEAQELATQSRLHLHLENHCGVQSTICLRLKFAPNLGCWWEL